MGVGLQVFSSSGLTLIDENLFVLEFSQKFTVTTQDFDDGRIKSYQQIKSENGNVDVLVAYKRTDTVGIVTFYIFKIRPTYSGNYGVQAFDSNGNLSLGITNKCASILGIINVNWAFDKNGWGWGLPNGDWAIAHSYSRYMIDNFQVGGNLNVEALFYVDKHVERYFVTNNSVIARTITYSNLYAGNAADNTHVISLADMSKGATQILVIDVSGL